MRWSALLDGDRFVLGAVRACIAGAITTALAVGSPRIHRSRSSRRQVSVLPRRPYGASSPAEAARVSVERETEQYFAARAVGRIGGHCSMSIRLSTARLLELGARAH